MRQIVGLRLSFNITLELSCHCCERLILPFHLRTVTCINAAEALSGTSSPVYTSDKGVTPETLQATQLHPAHSQLSGPHAKLRLKRLCRQNTERDHCFYAESCRTRET
jgi:hypothetical protein